MYSEFMTATGMSQNTMEVIVLSVIAILVLGVIIVMYWPFIIAGAAALFCVVVLANHKVPDAPKSKPVEIIESKVPDVDAIAKPVEQIKQEPFDEAKAFMEDCLNMTDYTKKQCQKLWNGREDEEVIAKEPVLFKLLDVDNKEYKQRRAEALKKPNAVVAQYTFR